MESNIQITPIISAINEVMASVDRVGKGSRNDHLRYDYSSEQDILEAIRPAMTAAGLMLVPHQIDIVGISEGRNYRVDLKTTYRLYHKSGVGYLQLQVMSSGCDQQDKAFSKAHTQSLKYAMINLFLLPRGDDPDRDAPISQPRRAQQKKPPAKKKAPEKIAAGSRRKNPGKISPQKEWYPRTDPEFHKVAHIAGGADIIDSLCEKNGWPSVDSWDKKRLTRFIEQVENGTISLC